MLVLSRKIGEEIVIGDNIRVTVVAIRGNQVRLGFSAPEDVAIQRSELRAFPEHPFEPDLCLATP
jgi:carbon storage regulator